MDFRQTIENLILELKLQRENFIKLQENRDNLKSLLAQNDANWVAMESEYKIMQDRILDEISRVKAGIIQNRINMEVEKKNQVAIVIITYNNSNLIKKQFECIQWFCKDDFDIIIVDNSTDPEAIKAIKYYNDTELKCKYYKTDASSKNGSDSHSYAANLSYFKFKDDYKYFMYLDHDCFPIKPFSIIDMLDGKIMVGVGQRKEELEYFWPGCVMWDNANIDRSLINFSTNHDLKVDTGGMLHLVIEKYGKGKCSFLNEIHVQNPNFNKSFYNFYAEINDGGFLHFVNGSNWAGAAEDNERLNSLMNILEEKIK